MGRRFIFFVVGRRDGKFFLRGAAEFPSGASFRMLCDNIDEAIKFDNEIEAIEAQYFFKYQPPAMEVIPVYEETECLGT